MSIETEDLEDHKKMESYDDEDDHVFEKERKSLSYNDKRGIN